MGEGAEEEAEPREEQGCVGVDVVASHGTRNGDPEDQDQSA
jgi:hypothetical protein